MALHSNIVLFVTSMLAVVLHNPDGAIAQTSCLAGPALHLNNVEALTTLVRNEVESKVEAEVARRLTQLLKLKYSKTGIYSRLVIILLHMTQ